MCSNLSAENNVYDRYRVCTFVFLDKKRNTNLDGEFLKKFEKGCNHNLRADYGLPRTMCDTCYYRVETMWKKATFVIPGLHLSQKISGNLFDKSTNQPLFRAVSFLHACTTSRRANFKLGNFCSLPSQFVGYFTSLL